MEILSLGEVKNLNQIPKLQVFKLGHTDPRKGKKMNEQFQGTTEQPTAERINSIDPSRRDLSGEGTLTDEQLEQLLAKHRGEDGEILGFVSQDAKDEADEDKIVH